MIEWQWEKFLIAEPNSTLRDLELSNYFFSCSARQNHMISLFWMYIPALLKKTNTNFFVRDIFCLENKTFSLPYL